VSSTLFIMHVYPFMACIVILYWHIGLLMVVAVLVAGEDSLAITGMDYLGEDLMA